MKAVFYGEDDYRIREEIRLLKIAGGDQMIGLDATQLEGDKLRVEELGTHTQALPFFGNRRIVEVRGLLTRFDSPGSRRSNRKQGRKQDIGLWVDLPNFLTRLPDTTDLVFVDGALENSNPILRLLQAESDVSIRRFPLLQGVALQEWIRNRVSDQGASIEMAAIRLLIEAWGGNLWGLQGEIEKLLLYTQRGFIDAGVTRELVTRVTDVSIFPLIDACMLARYEIARDSLENLLADGATASQILGLLARQVRLLLQAHEFEPRRVAPGRLARALGISSNFQAEKIARQSSSTSLERLRSLHTLLLESDGWIKGGRLPEGIALEILVARMCGVGNS